MGAVGVGDVDFGELYAALIVGDGGAYGDSVAETHGLRAC